LDEVPSFDFSPLDAAFSRLKASAWNYERNLSNLKKGSLSVKKKAEINNILKNVDQAMVSEGGLPRRDWFKNMIYAPGFYTGYGVKTLPGIREGLEQRNWNEVDTYIQEVAKTLDRVASKINSASNILKK
jgi:N-acetylated-alpha-linked acidic dipeptidase